MSGKYDEQRRLYVKVETLYISILLIYVCLYVYLYVCALSHVCSKSLKIHNNTINTLCTYATTRNKTESQRIQRTHLQEMAQAQIAREEEEHNSRLKYVGG